MIQPYRTLMQGGYQGECAWNGKTATIFGGNCYLGFNIIARLAQEGYQILLPYRCEHQVIRQNMVGGDYGKLITIDFDNNWDDPRVLACVQNSDVVISLIGTEHHWTIAEKSNVQIPAVIAKMVASSPKVSSFVHLSSFYANINSKNTIAKSKALGEMAVRSLYPKVNIVRPTNFYHFNDTFIQFYTIMGVLHKSILQRYAKHTIKRPVFLSDISKAIHNIVIHPEYFQGRTFEFYLDKEYYLSDVLAYIHKYTNYEQKEDTYLDFPFLLLPKFMGEMYPHKFLVGNIAKTILLNDYIRRDKSILTFKDAGVNPIPIEHGLQKVLCVHRTVIASHLEYIARNNTDMVIPPAHERLHYR